MKTSGVVLATAVAIPPAVLAVALLVGHDDIAHRIILAGTVVVLSVGACLLGYALFQRIVLRGPAAEFWPTLLTATGFLAYAARVAADVPFHTAGGIALNFGGLLLAIVGILLYARARRDRRAIAS